MILVSYSCLNVKVVLLQSWSLCMLFYSIFHSYQGICDGAAALVLASEAAVKQHKLTPLARLVSYGISGMLNHLNHSTMQTNDPLL